MTYEERKEQVKLYLGKTVDIKIDRPVGYVHKNECGSLTYPINYGYLPGVIGGDGEELDVYLLGVSEPVEEYTARIIGIVHRENDDEDKLIAVPDGVVFTADEIQKAVAFQERYYDTHIEVCNISHYECTAQHFKFNGLPDEILDACKGKLLVNLHKHRFKLFSHEEYKKLLKQFDGGVDQNRYFRVLFSHTVEVSDARSLFSGLFQACKSDDPSVSSDAVFYLRFTVCLGFVGIAVLDIKEP